jgi:hypothetical protein
MFSAVLAGKGLVFGCVHKIKSVPQSVVVSDNINILYRNSWVNLWSNFMICKCFIQLIARELGSEEKKGVRNVNVNYLLLI